MKINFKIFYFFLKKKGPLFSCTPEIATLDYDSINSTLDIKCTFVNRIEDPSDVIWKFRFNKNERIINDFDGGVLQPFRHYLKKASGVVQFPGGESIEGATQSILRINLLNETYYTNYTIMHTRDSCQQTIRVQFRERALGYSRSSSIFNISSLISSIMLLITFLTLSVL